MQSNRDTEDVVDSTDRFFSRRNRSKTDVTANRTLSHDNDSHSQLNCALIMVHIDTVQMMTAKRQCERYGYHPIIIPLPSDEDDAMATTSIDRLTTVLAKETAVHTNAGKTLVFKYVLVEANYSHVGQPIPNYALLSHILDANLTQNIIAQSNTPACLDHLTQCNFPVTPTNNFLATIKNLVEADPTMQRKLSLN